MDTQLLRTFLEVARTRHFGRAAAALYLTQSAVSARIRQLEEAVGAPLLERAVYYDKLTEDSLKRLKTDHVEIVWVHDVAQDFMAKRKIRDHRHPVEQRWLEVLLQHRADVARYLAGRERLRCLLRQLHRQIAGEVAGEKQDRVAKIDCSPLAVGEYSFVKHLMEQVQDVEVGLLDFIEQDHRVRPLTHRFG